MFGPGTKSGALLLRDPPGPHYLFWGDTHIRVAISYDLRNFTVVNENFISPRSAMFDSKLVEAGPLPLLLSDGNYIFFHNSADNNNAYHAEYVILNGTDPSAPYLQRAEVFFLLRFFFAV